MQRFGSQDGNSSPTLLRSAGNHFYTAIPLIWGRTSRKRLVLVRSEVLGQFAKTSTVHYKYSRYDLENLQHQFQMQISPKPKTFSEYFIASMKFTLNSEYFEKKDQSHSVSITEIIDCETGSYWNV